MSTINTGDDSRGTRETALLNILGGVLQLDASAQSLLASLLESERMPLAEKISRVREYLDLHRSKRATLELLATKLEQLDQGRPH